MGIKGLAKLLSDEAPDCIREVELKSLNGRKIAVDASMAIYQFLIAVRSGGPNTAAVQLTNADGETTSHIQGMFNRTIRFLTEGMKPVFIFDGKPPSMKSGELQKRREKRILAQQELQKATEEGNIEEQDKQSKRLVRAGQKENNDCQKLLKLMGVPVLVAPCEAEAQAAALAKAGLVYATGTEDMDALTFQTPVLIRKLTFANQSKSMIQSMNYQAAITGLELTHEEFVDLCILLGCDYCDSIRGVGPKTALKLIRQHHTIEEILKHIDMDKYGVPDNWLPPSKRKKNKAKNNNKANGDDDNKDNDNDGEDYGSDKEEAQPKKDNEENEEEEEETDEDFIPAFVQARDLFFNHEVTTDVDLKWKPPQEQELTKFLVEEMGFNPERVASNIEKLKAAHKANSKPQARLDSFFAVKPPSQEQLAKRKAKAIAAKETAKKNAKKQKTATGRKRR